MSHRVDPVPQYPCSHVAARLKGEFRHIAANLLGSEHPVLCAKWWIRCCLYEAVLSKIPLQLLHLKAIDCFPPPG